MSKPLDHALGLYMEGIRDGEIDGALERHLGARYTQHSTGVGDGAAGFRAFFSDFLVRVPKRDIRVVHTIEDGARAFVHAYQNCNDGAAEWVTMDMFDSEAGTGRIVEHWDVIQQHVATSPSGNDTAAPMPGATTRLPDVPDDKQAAQTERSRAVVREYVKTVLTSGEFDRVSEFVHHDVVQRCADLKDGSEALVQALKTGAHPRTEMLFMILVQDDRVAVLSKTTKEATERASVDLYRVDNGLIVEHWGVWEPILPRDQWGNSGKF